MRRLAAMSRKARVQALQPVPWFPILRPRPGWCREGQREVDGVCIRSLGMFYIPKYFKSLDAYWLYRSIIGELSALRRRGSLHVIDAHFAYPDGVGCVMAARQLGLPVVVTVRGVEEEYLEEASIGVKIRDALANADGCICVSHSLRERMIEAGVPESRTRVIHNGVDRGVFAPGNRESARAELGIGQGERLIVSVGNLLSVKCHDVLLRAFAALQQKMSKTRLVIIGGASYEPGEPDRLKRLCSELGIASRVRFAGRLPTAAVAAWLRAADAFALASRREGCCNALLEALSTGVPAVVTAVGDKGADIVEEGQGRNVINPMAIHAHPEN